MFLQFVKQVAIPVDFKFCGGDAVLDGVSLEAQYLGPIDTRRKRLGVHLLEILLDRTEYPAGLFHLPDVVPDRSKAFLWLGKAGKKQPG